MKNFDTFSAAKIKHTSTVELIVENLIKLIKEKNLEIGDRLPPERVLCDLIGVSRPALREALKALQIMNIVDIRQGSGTFVRQLEPAQIVEHLDIVFNLDSSLYADLYEARRIIESSITKLAAEKITDEEIKELEKLIAESEQYIDDEEKFFEKDLEMHEMILRISGNRVMPVFMQSINKLSLVVRKQSNVIPSIRQNTINDHREIFEAMKNRDCEKAAEKMSKHITNVERSLLGKESEVYE